GRRVAVAGDPSAMAAESSRFNGELRWGLVAAIDQPSSEDRVRFIQAKSSALGVDMPEEVQHYLALRVRSSIRDLEGAVNRVTALARISAEPLGIDFAAKALQPVSAAPPASLPSPTPSVLIDAVCQQLGISQSDLAGSKRARNLTYARHVAMYLLREDA